MMHEQEKSDSPVVAKKLANKHGRPCAESVEPRGEAKGNMDWQRTRRTQSRVNVSQRLDHVRQAARQRKKERFTALFHRIDIDMLEAAFFSGNSKVPALCRVPVAAPGGSLTSPDARGRDAGTSVIAEVSGRSCSSLAAKVPQEILRPNLTGPVDTIALSRW